MSTLHIIKRGFGYIKNPKKSIYNNIYNKTTIGASNYSPRVQAQKNISSNNNHYCNSWEDIEINFENLDIKFDKTNEKNFYNIIDNNTVKIKNNVFSKKQIKAYKNIFLLLGLIFTFLGIVCILFIFIGIVFFYMFCNYNKIYKELYKKG